MQAISALILTLACNLGALPASAGSSMPGKPPADAAGAAPRVQGGHGATALALAAAQLEPGQSVKLATNNLVATLAPLGDVLAWGNTGVWDAASGTGIWIGKTANAARYRRVHYDEKSNAWSESTNLHKELVASRIGHGYDHNALDPATGDLYFRLYSSKLVVHHWDRARDTWSRIDSTRAAICCEALEWWDGRGLVYSDSAGVDLWDGAQWTRLVKRGAVKPIGYHSIGEYQRNADVYVYGGGNAGGTRLYKLDRQNRLSLLPPAPFALGSNASGQQGILVQDPASTRLIAMRRPGIAWAELDPLAGTWTTLQVSRGDPYVPADGAPNLGHVKTIAIPISPHGVIMFVSQYAGMTTDDVWLYKHSARSP